VRRISVAGAGPDPPFAASPTFSTDPLRRARREGFVVKHKNRLVGFESATDLMTVGLIIALGLAMVIGLFTASGAVTW
jgi:hypothetical protein